MILEQSAAAGGGFVHQMSITRLFSRKAVGFDVRFYATERNWLELLERRGLQAKHLPVSLLRRWLSVLRRNLYLNRLLRRFSRFNWFERRLLGDGIDLVFFPGPSQLALDCEHLNYVITVWDLCHRDFPEFPEVRAARAFEERELFYRAALPKAAAVLADSDTGRRNIVRRYAVDEERIHVAPFITPEIDSAGEATEQEVRGKYALDAPFVFYPAQFWAHKNHVYILQGLHHLRQNTNLRVQAVFCGGDQGNVAHVKATAERLGLADQVRILGFVPRAEVIALYRSAVALVMPTYFGPTNLPPLEAFALGVPVIYPDLPGLRDQVADAAVLVDLDDPNSLAQALADLLQGRTDRAALVRAGRARLTADAEGAYWAVLEAVFRQFRVRLQCWTEA